MISEEVRDILCQPVIVRVTTITAEGYPHTVPVWFILDGDDLVLFTERKAKKVANASINPKGSIAIGGDPVGSPTLLAEGDFVIEDDPNYVMTERITRHYDPENAEQWLEMWKKSDYVILRLKLRRLIRIV